MNKPNILWIITDQQSETMMSCSGNTYVRTPNIDRIANNGVRFTNSYCTNPVCMPSRFSLMTGLYPGDINVYSNIPESKQPKLPEAVIRNGLGRLLKQQGYTAYYGGKQHLPSTDANSLGFDYICKDEREGLAEKFSAILRDNSYDKPFAFVASFINPHDICHMAIRDAVKQGEIDDVGTRMLYECCQKEVNICGNAEKLPPNMEEEIFFDKYCPPLPDNYIPSHDEPEAIEILQHERPFKKYARQSYTDKQWRIHRWAYKNLTEKVDAQIGQLLDALEEAGLWQDTVIIFTSDHGDMDAAHKMEHKECLYQECCKIPLIIKGSGQTVPQIEDSLVCNGLDIFPTILDYAGVKAPEYLEGFSLKNRVQDGLSLPIRKQVVVECENGIMAVDKCYKYAHYNQGERAIQFYDLEENPGETYNQINEARYEKEIERMSRAVIEHKDSRRLRFGSEK